MGSYGVIKEALLVKLIAGKATIVQKLVPSTVNGVVFDNNVDGGFEVSGGTSAICAINNGGAFGFSTMSDKAKLQVLANIPGSGVKVFGGSTKISTIDGVGKCIKCEPIVPAQNALYTNLCLVVESPGLVFHDGTN